MITIIDAGNAAQFDCTVEPDGSIKVPHQSLDSTTVVEECKGSKDGLVLKGRINRTNKQGDVRYNVNVPVDCTVPWAVLGDIVLRKVMYDLKPEDKGLEVVDSGFRTFVPAVRTGGTSAKPLEGEELSKAMLAAEQFGFVVPEGCTKTRFQRLLGAAFMDKGMGGK